MTGKNVYFIKPVGMPGPIKIGCSIFVEHRLLQLMVWSPIPLEVLYTEPGTHDLERNLHRCFADYHSHLEWFHPGERLVKAIERLKAGEKIADVVDLNDKRGSIFAGRTRADVPADLDGYRSYQMKIMWARKKACDQAKVPVYVPFAVSSIMHSWQGGRYPHKPNPRRPTDAQFAILDEYIGDPVKHSQTEKERWPSTKKTPTHPQLPKESAA